jgi:Protein of unknown function (DUF4446)
MSPATSSALALLALGLAIAAIVLATIANRRWARRPVRSAPDRKAPTDADRPTDPDRPADSGRAEADRQVLAAALGSLRDQVDGLSTRVEGLGAESAAVRSDLEALHSHVADLARRTAEAGDPTALRHVALVRYDAFADVGGRLSYSVALLDDTGSGLVLTTLAGKADVRTYVRTISAGTPDGTLTAEEQQAIDAAVGSRQ